MPRDIDPAPQTSCGIKSQATSGAAGGDESRGGRVVVDGGHLHDPPSNSHPSGRRYASASDRVLPIRVYAAGDDPSCVYVHEKYRGSYDSRAIHSAKNHHHIGRSLDLRVQNLGLDVQRTPVTPLPQ